MLTLNVSHFRGLQGINLSGCFKVRDVTPLASMSSLRTVIVHDRMSGMQHGARKKRAHTNWYASMHMRSGLWLILIIIVYDSLGDPVVAGRH